jgi:alpha-L-fucosidase 2
MRGLRARGGFAVDVDWKDGQAALSKACHKRGNGTRTRLRYDGKLADLALRPGQSVRVTANDGKLIVTPLRSAGK